MQVELEVMLKNHRIEVEKSKHNAYVQGMLDHEKVILKKIEFYQKNFPSISPINELLAIYHDLLEQRMRADEKFQSTFNALSLAA